MDKQGQPYNKEDSEALAAQYSVNSGTLWEAPMTPVQMPKKLLTWADTPKDQRPAQARRPRTHGPDDAQTVFHPQLYDAAQTPHRLPLATANKLLHEESFADILRHLSRDNQYGHMLLDAWKRIRPEGEALNQERAQQQREKQANSYKPKATTEYNLSSQIRDALQLSPNASFLPTPGADPEFFRQLDIGATQKPMGNNDTPTLFTAYPPSLDASEPIYNPHTEEAAQYLRAMFLRHKSEARTPACRWTRVPGPCPPEEYERKEYDLKGDEIRSLDAATEPAGQRLKRLCSRYALPDTDNPDHYYVLTGPVWCLSSFFSEYGDRCTALRLYDYWLSMPIIWKGPKRGHSQERNELKRQRIQRYSDRAAAWILQHELPTTKLIHAQYRTAWILLKEILAAEAHMDDHLSSYSMTHIPNLDNYTETKMDAMCRSTFDERHAVRLNTLPAHIQLHLHPSHLPIPDRLYVRCNINYRCNNVLTKIVDGEEITRPCGRICLSTTSWIHSKGGKHRRHGCNIWECIDCNGSWSRHRSGTRMVTLTTAVGSVQLLLNEPPTQLDVAWQKSRIEFYQRVEGPQPRRDTDVPSPTPATTHRYDYSATDADNNEMYEMWGILLRQHDSTDSIVTYYRRVLSQT